MDKRQRQLAQWKQLLNTTEGQSLMEELETVWDANTLLSDDPQRTGHNIGLRDAFKFLKYIQTGEFNE